MGRFLNAALQVLRDEKRPLRPQELVQLANDRGYLETRGKTPWQTMKSKLSTNILKEKEHSLFMRTSAGLFSLREWSQREFVAPRFEKGLLEEDIAVIPRESLGHFIPGPGLVRSPFDIRRLLTEYAPMRRSEAERDFSVIQLISVFLVTFGPALLTYKRTKRLPESRLHGEYSAFFGGHITPRDLGGMAPLFEPFDLKHDSGNLQRELGEELRLASTPEMKYYGLIYESSRLVSSQHLGIIFRTYLASPNFTIGERGFLSDPRFETIEQIRKRFDEFENWSQLIIRHLSEHCDED